MEYEKIVKPVVLEWAKEERVSGASIMLLIKDLCATLEAVEHSVQRIGCTCGAQHYPDEKQCHLCGLLIAQPANR